MKLMHITDIDKLFKVIDECDGKVELVGEDIRINLKSKLSQYFSLAKLFSDGDVGEIGELELLAENPDDAAKLIAFMIG